MPVVLAQPLRLVLATFVVGVCWSLQQPVGPNHALPRTPSVQPTTPTSRRQALVQATGVAVAGLVGSPLSSGASTTRIPESFGKFIGEPVQLSNGVVYTDYEVGSGKPPEYGQVLRVAYREYLKLSRSAEPVLVDSTFRRRSILMLKHGNGKMIRGLEEAIHTMNVGGKRRVVIPPDMAYTGKNQMPFPVQHGPRKRMGELYSQMQPSGSVIVDVELVDAFDDDADPGFYQDTDIPPELMEKIAERLKEIARAFV